MKPPRRDRQAGWSLLTFSLAALAVVVLGGLAGYLLFSYLVFGFTLSRQPGMVTLPEQFYASAKVTNRLDIIMHGEIFAEVPFKQDVELPLRGRYRSEVEIDAPVPVKFDVVYDGTIPVNSIADITARANFNFQDVKSYRNLEIQARLPMQMALPVKLTAPIDTTLRLQYKGPLIMGVNQTIRAPVDTTLSTVLRVNQQVSTPVSADMKLLVYAPKQPVGVEVTHADIRMRLRTLRLERAVNTAEPVRNSTP